LHHRKFLYVFILLFIISVFGLNVSAQSSDPVSTEPEIAGPAAAEPASATPPMNAKPTVNTAPAASPTPAATIASSKPPEKRLFGVVPNYRTTDASSPYTPLSSRKKLGIASHDSFDWPSYAIAVPMTFLMPNAKDTKMYGTGWSGFANRYVRSSADQIIGNMLTEGFMPTLLHQDPRYFRPGTGTLWSRLGTAISQIFITRKDSGGHTFNSSEFLGNTIAVSISNAYSPNLRSWSASTEKLGLAIGTDMFSNVVKEFGPDVKERVFHRHHTKI
jgi:hypothetical protein